MNISACKIRLIPRNFWLVTVTTIISALILAGCGGDGGDDNNDSDTSGGGDLILSAGEAWVEDTSVLSNGYIFNTDSTVLLIKKSWDEWRIHDYGTYTVSGNRIAITVENRVILSATYSASEDNLSITEYGKTDVFIKASSLSIYHFGGDLVNKDYEAWTDLHNDDIDNHSGFIFHADNTYKDIAYNNGTWIVTQSGTYSIEDNSVRIHSGGGFYSISYGVSICGDTVKMSMNDVLIRTPNVYASGSGVQKMPANNNGFSQIPFILREE